MCSTRCRSMSLTVMARSLRLDGLSPRVTRTRRAPMLAVDRGRRPAELPACCGTAPWRRLTAHRARPAGLIDGRRFRGTALTRAPFPQCPGSSSRRCAAASSRGRPPSNEDGQQDTHPDGHQRGHPDRHHTERGPTGELGPHVQGGVELPTCQPTSVATIRAVSGARRHQYAATVRMAAAEAASRP